MRTSSATSLGWIMTAWIVGGLGVAPSSSASVGVWTTRADMPTARAMSCASVVQERIYVIGGAVGIDSTLAVVEMYDAETDAWETRASMPAPRAAAAACVVDGIIYVLGGGRLSSSGTVTVFAYNPVTDEWMSKADMATPRQAPAACAVDDIIYVIGGLEQATAPTAVVEAYDPKTDSWTQKTPMPSAAGAVSGAVVDGVIYVFGGGQSGGPSRPSVFAYDPRTDAWSRKADMPTARMGLCTASVDGIIYAIGGTAYGGGPAVATVEAYNPVTDSWTVVANMPTARKYPTCGLINGTLHVIGGVASAPLATLEVYDLTPPPPDFNGDGNIDGKDVLILAAHWDQADSVCDIAPEPFGDGVVDLLDLSALANRIGEEVHDPTLVAHWPLDETEGMIASESAGEHDATVIGVPAWRLAGGVVHGALEFNGMTFAAADFVLDPSDGPFSALAWVKGGAPGQVIVSQQGGANWLMADALDGSLMTNLRAGGRSPVSLGSRTVIADGNWHRAAFTWDGVNRRLYMDGLLVAEDTQITLGASAGNQLMGCGENMAGDTFWTGLIDDVRIYNRAVKP